VAKRPRKGNSFSECRCSWPSSRRAFLCDTTLCQSSVDDDKRQNWSPPAAAFARLRQWRCKAGGRSRSSPPFSFPKCVIWRSTDLPHHWGAAPNKCRLGVHLERSHCIEPRQSNQFARAGRHQERHRWRKYLSPLADDNQLIALSQTRYFSILRAQSQITWYAQSQRTWLKPRLVAFIVASDIGGETDSRGPGSR
jgi:hypothetical protein